MLEPGIACPLTLPGKGFNDGAEDVRRSVPPVLLGRVAPAKSLLMRAAMSDTDTGAYRPCPDRSRESGTVAGLGHGSGVSLRPVSSWDVTGAADSRWQPQIIGPDPAGPMVRSYAPTRRCEVLAAFGVPVELWSLWPTALAHAKPGGASCRAPYSRSPLSGGPRWLSSSTRQPLLSFDALFTSDLSGRARAFQRRSSAVGYRWIRRRRRPGFWPRTELNSSFYRPPGKWNHYRDLELTVDVIYQTW